MKSKISLTLAALFATGAASFAVAQDELTPGVAPPWVDEPTASTYVKEGGDADLANRIVQVLNADASLKNSKISVQPEKGVVLLTGSVATTEQAQHAAELANGQVGNGSVVNAIQPDRIVYKSPQLEMENAQILLGGSGTAAAGSGEPEQQPAMQIPSEGQQS